MEIIDEIQRRGDLGESTRKLAKVFNLGKSTVHTMIARTGVYRKAVLA